LIDLTSKKSLKLHLLSKIKKIKKGKTLAKITSLRFPIVLDQVGFRLKICLF